jgi:hypothetical protein
MRVLEFYAVSTAILEYYPVVLSTADLALMCILQHCSPSALLGRTQPNKNQTHFVHYILCHGVGTEA